MNIVVLASLSGLETGTRCVKRKFSLKCLRAIMVSVLSDDFLVLAVNEKLSRGEYDNVLESPHKTELITVIWHLYL